MASNFRAEAAKEQGEICKLKESAHAHGKKQEKKQATYYYCASHKNMLIAKNLPAASGPTPSGWPRSLEQSSDRFSSASPCRKAHPQRGKGRTNAQPNRCLCACVRVASTTREGLHCSGRRWRDACTPSSATAPRGVYLATAA
jgi:hypothetical protein